MTLILIQLMKYFFLNLHILFLELLNCMFILQLNAIQFWFWCFVFLYPIDVQSYPCMVIHVAAIAQIPYI